MREFRLLLWFAIATATAVFGAVYVAEWLAPSPPGSEERQQTAEQVARQIVTGEFTLVAGDGRVVTDADYRGEWLLIFFGFTRCPDICPTTLATMALIMDELGEQSRNFQPVFISVDPARDTPDVLAAYVAVFHPKIIGLTGTEEQVAAAAKSHAAYYSKVQLTGSTVAASDYVMDHTAHLYLMDPHGDYATVYSPAQTVEAIARDIRERMRHPD